MPHPVLLLDHIALLKSQRGRGTGWVQIAIYGFAKVYLSRLSILQRSGKQQCRTTTQWSMVALNPHVSDRLKEPSSAFFKECCFIKFCFRERKLASNHSDGNETEKGARSSSNAAPFMWIKNIHRQIFLTSHLSKQERPYCGFHMNST